jgi:uncharacterized protein (DUF2147 family)
MVRGVAARGLAIILLAFTANTGSVSAFAQAQIEGVWQTQLRSEITISRCPEGYCGRISKVIVPERYLQGSNGAAIEQMRPEDFFDYNNKDPQLRDRPILGLQILTLTPTDRPNIYDGEIYNPEDGNTYSGYMEVLGPDKVRLNGCVLFNVICRGEDWVRVSER